MDDDDGAFMVELMAGQPPEAILATMYNGSTSCAGCGTLMNPIMSLFGGTYCPECTTKKGAKHAQNLVGR